MIYRITISGLLLFLLPSIFSAQNSVDKIEGLNDYVVFANESIHGMLIAHRLFENYNQDINKYVDLPGHQLNYYNNQDLPEDLFEDPEHWFYEVSPKSLYQRTKSNDTFLSTDSYDKLQLTAEYILNTTISSNALRIEIGDAINSRDLSNLDTLYSIYEMLEQAVDAYDLLNAQVLILQDQLQKENQAFEENGFEPKEIQLIKLFQKIHTNSVEILKQIKIGKKEDLPSLKNSLRATLLELESHSLKSDNLYVPPSFKRSKHRVAHNIREILSNVDEFLSQDKIPEEYALYGRSYYYYNTKMINKINRYGNGLVEALNNMIDQLELPMVHFLEIPHYLQVIYPNKVEKQVQVIKATLPEIHTLPDQLLDRSVSISDKRHVILVDGPEVEMEIFDHLKQDGDIISLYYNGIWIFENLSLERKPRSFILKLNEIGKNFLILHAVNEGSVPPNTIGINYTHKGRKKRYIMQSNLKTSQMVEIKIDD